MVGDKMNLKLAIFLIVTVAMLKLLSLYESVFRELANSAINSWMR